MVYPLCSLGLGFLHGETTVGYVNTSPPPSSVLIVGAGLAGLRSIGELREQGFTGHITLVGAEDVPPYDRPPLSKQLFATDEPVWLAEDLGIALDLADEVLLSVQVVDLEIGAGAPASQASDDEWPGYRIRLNDGRTLRADAVILACGSVPMLRPEWAGGADHNGDVVDGVRVLHSAADAARLRADLTAKPGIRLICIGAGWIGAELSGLAADHSCDVTVVEAGATPLLSSLGPEVGGLVASWYDEVTLLTHAMVTSAHAHEVHLADGRRLTADVVVAAVGARPATDWLGGSVAGEVALHRTGAINVDAHMRLIDLDGAPIPHLAGVRAVGDCVTRKSVRHGHVPGGHWDAALRGPAAAVASLLEPGALAAEAGSLPAPDPAPYVFSTQFGRELVLYGQPGPDDDVVLRGDPSVPAGAPGWAALYFERSDFERPEAELGGAQDIDAENSAPSGRVLTGVFLVDRPRDVAAARKLFAGPHLPRLDPEQAADPAVKLTAARVLT